MKATNTLTYSITRYFGTSGFRDIIKESPMEPWVTVQLPHK